MRARNWVLVLLVVPFFLVLYPPLYAALQPRFLGLPFFIWYQFAVSIFSALLTIVVYLVDSSGEPDDEASTAAEPRREV